MRELQTRLPASTAPRTAYLAVDRGQDGRRCSPPPAASAASSPACPATTSTGSPPSAPRYGMAFQIVDDMLDVVATDEQLGKPAGHDLVEGVYTLPVLRALDDRARATSCATLLGGRSTPPSWTRPGPSSARAGDRGGGRVPSASTSARPAGRWARSVDQPSGAALAGAADHLLEAPAADLTADACIQRGGVIRTVRRCARTAPSSSSLVTMRAVLGFAAGCGGSDDDEGATTAEGGRRSHRRSRPGRTAAPPATRRRSRTSPSTPRTSPSTRARR